MTKDASFPTGALVIILPRELVKEINGPIPVGDSDPDPVREGLLCNIATRVLTDWWAHPNVTNLDPQSSDIPNVKWGEIAIYLGPQRISVRAGTSRLGRARKKRANLHHERMVVHVFQFGDRLVVGELAEYADVGLVSDRLFATIAATVTEDP